MLAEVNGYSCVHTRQAPQSCLVLMPIETACKSLLRCIVARQQNTHLPVELAPVGDFVRTRSPFPSPMRSFDIAPLNRKMSGSRSELCPSHDFEVVGGNPLAGGYLESRHFRQ